MTSALARSWAPPWPSTAPAAGPFFLGGLNGYSTNAANAVTFLFSGFTWEGPIAASTQPKPAPVAVSSIAVQGGVAHAQQTTIITIILTAPAPQDGTVVNFTGAIFAPGGADLGPVAVFAGLTLMDLEVAFAGAAGSSITISAQIAGTPAVNATFLLQ
jgi:hypothetical protein